MSELKTLAERLTPEQKKRLEALSETIALDKITVSFSVEDRDLKGRKKSAFYSVTAGRGAGAEMTTMQEPAGTAAGFKMKDVAIVRCLLRKHVVAAVYEDAARAGVIANGPETRNEVITILKNYDDQIVRLISREG